jgi:hypothetical protein
VPLLNGRLELHAPNCRGTCRPDDCVADLEAFCGSIRAAHFGVGVKRGDGTVNGQLTLTHSDREDLLAYLLGRAWELSQRFNPADDGRGSNRLAGFLTQRLHFACTDWTRARWGSTRFGPIAVFTPTAHPEVHITEASLDVEYEGDYEDVLDLDAARPGTREALELLQPWLDGEVRSAKEIGPGAESALTLVRGEARRQGLEPGGEERQELAGRVRDLWERGLHFKEIAAELGISSARPGSLLREYHPEVARGGCRPTAFVR